jgi:hypothetical protein
VDAFARRFRNQYANCSVGSVHREVVLGRHHRLRNRRERIVIASSAVRSLLLFVDRITVLIPRLVPGVTRSAWSAVKSCQPHRRRLRASPERQIAASKWRLADTFSIEIARRMCAGR